MSINSSEICSALRLRYPSNSHALLFEVANATGSNARRFADAVAIGLWPSHGHAIEGVEVKVSRSDFLNELKQPEKSNAVFQFCNFWWLACPKDMVKPDEIPSTWGLLELHGDVLRTKVKAPKLTPTACTIGFIASLLRRHAGVDEEMARQEIAREVQKVRAQVKEENDRNQRNRYNARVECAEKAMQVVENIKTTTGIDLVQLQHHDTELLAAIQLNLKLRGRWHGPLEGIRKASEQIIAAIDESGLLPTKLEQAA